ncbi:hypothetical protein CXK91_12510 [Stutzerimonas stutzeri]|uniref:Uncharacterized protein n=1 Tax=Stutzerimonas stutzeri TaxID=316 RepID=A0A2S4AP16_STUST|nr:hypothetical protein [Stutzerimonas stutzeri]MCQ4265084.1 hypothetical protein [Stutzerimonas stutzeri]POH83002.1 hypothetical protein CXK91_12510 [Stutzerimonas stutzeri]
MSAMSLAWLLIGTSLCSVMVLLVLLWLLWMGRQSQCRELTVLRELLDGLGQVIVRLEQDKAELTSGLRAEKAHVAQLRRQLELLRS